MLKYSGSKWCSLTYPSSPPLEKLQTLNGKKQFVKVGSHKRHEKSRRGANKESWNHSLESTWRNINYASQKIKNYIKGGSIALINLFYNNTFRIAYITKMYLVEITEVLKPSDT